MLHSRITNRMNNQCSCLTSNIGLKIEIYISLILLLFKLTYLNLLMQNDNKKYKKYINVSK